MTHMLISLLLSLSVAFSENSSLSNQVSSSHHNSTQTFPIEYIHATSHISTNAPCRFNISQSNTGSNPKTVASALQSSCSDGYEITLMDSIHYEYVTIIKTKNIPVLIQSGQLIRTVWIDASGYVDLEIALEYCKSKTELTSDCACDINSTTYPESQCKKDNLCLTDLVHQNSTNCPCLSTADPRANGICPAYCNSKDEFTLNCVCELGSSIYPQATCEKDKLCIVDLIYQSVSNCPYLEFNDPRGESLCKFSDPDPTDPIIHDPPEKDPEIDQEQESGSKQDDEKTFNMIWIIFIVIGILAIVVIVIITFFIFRSRNKRKQIEIKKKNQVIQIEVKERIIEVQKSDQNRTKTRNIVHSVKDDDNQSESSSESSSSSSSSTSSSSSPFSSSSSISSSSPISSPSLHINISETPHQSFASERSFRTASESHRG
ncbi:MAG: hypothetical protein EZS28_028949, partial [Streblomastix strix]